MLVNDQRVELDLANKLRQLFQHAAKRLIVDWQTNKYYSFAGVLLFLTTLLVLAYYMNHPRPDLDPDTPEYLSIAQRIQTQGQLIDPHRLPGFSLLITLVFALMGQGNLMAVSIANAVLFII